MRQGSPTELLVVSGEPLWPGGDGSGGRAAGLVEALAGRFSVRVLAPVGAGGSSDAATASAAAVGAGFAPLPDEAPVPRLMALLSPQPRLGRALLGPLRSQALLRAVADHRPRAVLFTAGYLSAAAPTIDRPIFVDFPSLSVRRPTSSSALESAKARWWEPVEARRAVVASATTPDDVARLASWGARALLVRDGSWAPLADAIEEVVRADGAAGTRS